eukprot:7825685-Prorocentrum_lima.AAC.1
MVNVPSPSESTSVGYWRSLDCSVCLRDCRSVSVTEDGTSASDSRVANTVTAATERCAAVGLCAGASGVVSGRA